MSVPLVTIEGLRVDFDTAKGRRTVVDGVNLEIAFGEVVGILGESGSGKTITTLALLGLIDGYPGVVDGKIAINTPSGVEDLLTPLLTHVRKKKEGFTKDLRRWNRDTRKMMQKHWGDFMTAIFQHPKASLDPLETIGAQVEESVRLAHPSFTSKERSDEVIDWLGEVQLTDPVRVANSYPHELSGGMCQRAMIAVAIAREPRLLIADEPTTGLDSTVRAEIVELFRAIVEDKTCSLIYISHDIREVLYLSDRVVVMRHGRVVESVSADDLHKGRGVRHPYTELLMSASELAFAE